MNQSYEANAQKSPMQPASGESIEPSTTAYVPHPATALIPPCRSEEFEALKADIWENGQQEPIVLHEGRILDGLTRYRACTELGIKPTFIKYSGPSPEDYVISKNLHRRHLTSSQMAVIAAGLIAPYSDEATQRMKLGKGQDGSGGRGRKNPRPILAEGLSQRPRDVLARKFGVSKTMIQEALRLQRSSSDLLAKVRAGKISLSQALKLIGPVRSSITQRNAEPDQTHERSDAKADHIQPRSITRNDGEPPARTLSEPKSAAPVAGNPSPKIVTQDRPKRGHTTTSGGDTTQRHAQKSETGDLVTIRMESMHRLVLSYRLMKAMTVGNPNQKVNSLAAKKADALMAEIREQVRTTGDAIPPDTVVISLVLASLFPDDPEIARIAALCLAG